MKILVTGISGRIGANLALALIGAGHEVRGLVWPKDRRLEKLKRLDAKLIEGDLTDPDDVERAARGADAICHLGAAFQGGGPFSSQDYFETNVRGTFNVLECALRHSDRLAHVFYASTDAAYEKYVPGGMRQPIREDETTVAPVGWYALSKILGEEMCLGYHRRYGLPVTAFRFAMTLAGDEILDWAQFRLSHWLQVYEGKHGETEGQVYKELQRLSGDGERLLVARDTEGRSFKKHIADVRDIVLGFLSALGKETAIGETFQLAGPAPFTWEEAVPYLTQKLGMEYVDVRLAGHVPTYYEFDLSKAKRLFGYQPAFDIFKMIDSAIAFRHGEVTDLLPTHIPERGGGSDAL
ncbi:MAG: NAD(P)-dependent oxidoreductase [Anaerolineae bacterium]|nr:NAD(P)-dependent oxidoreductase [Anaerolineae bacterium]